MVIEESSGIEPHSTNVSSYGIYDTSTIDNVTVTFAVSQL
jgi:hypothetical protein